MKFQYLAVVFVIIMLPIVLVMSFYVQTQTDVMKRQGEYRANLSDATHDAIKAFQINTTNSYYSSVSDSKIRDIEAAVNAFYNSLTANLNYNKSDLQAYVPAIVFTLYDGYYIYGKRYNVYPKEEVEINESGELIEMEIIRDKGNNEVEEIVNPDLYEYGLKPFVYYSCQYQKGSDNNFVINYTLDNFISIYGYITCKNEETGVRERQYINKSGHLIKINSDSNRDFNGEYNGVTIENKTEELTEFLKFSNQDGELEDGKYRYVVHQNQKVYINNTSDESKQYFWYDQGAGHYIQGVTTRAAIAETIKVSSSYEYYKEAYEFSKWFYENLGDIIQDNIRTVVRKADGKIEVTNGGTNLSFQVEKNERLFKVNEDPEDPESTFNQHRIAVIKNAIETNLVAAINSYNSNANSFSYALPKLAEEDWEKVVNNVCMISFMQGMPLGTKYFNDYVVIPNDKNNEFVDNDALYLITNDGKYHLANCPYLVENIHDHPDMIVGGYINTAFQRQTVEQTIGEEKKTFYYYRHVYDSDPPNKKYISYTPCYQCLVNSSGRYDLDEDIIYNTTGRVTKDGVRYDIRVLRQKYFTIFGREKNNLYKTNR